jgi:hypothetical protein
MKLRWGCLLRYSRGHLRLPQPAPLPDHQGIYGDHADELIREGVKLCHRKIRGPATTSDGLRGAYEAHLPRNCHYGGIYDCQKTCEEGFTVGLGMPQEDPLNWDLPTLERRSQNNLQSLQQSLSGNWDSLYNWSCHHLALLDQYLSWSNCSLLVFDYLPPSAYIGRPHETLQSHKTTADRPAFQTQLWIHVEDQPC